jgi:hypothetical protein
MPIMASWRQSDRANCGMFMFGITDPTANKTGISAVTSHFIRRLLPAEHVSRSGHHLVRLETEFSLKLF